MTDIKIINGCIEFEGFTIARLNQHSVPATVAWKFAEALQNCYSADELEQIKSESFEEGYEQRESEINYN